MWTVLACTIRFRTHQGTLQTPPKKVAIHERVNPPASTPPSTESHRLSSPPSRKLDSRTSSAQSFIKSTFSNSNFKSLGKYFDSADGSPTSLFKKNRKSSPAPQQDISSNGAESPAPGPTLENNPPPSLEAVGRALVHISLCKVNPKKKEPYVSQLMKFADENHPSPDDFQQKLLEARHERDQGMLLSCGVKCVMIIHHEEAGVEVKIRAYLTLAGLAKGGHAGGFFEGS